MRQRKPPAGRLRRIAVISVLAAALFAATNVSFPSIAAAQAEPPPFYPPGSLSSDELKTLGLDKVFGEISKANKSATWRISETDHKIIQAAYFFIFSVPRCEIATIEKELKELAKLINSPIRYFGGGAEGRANREKYEEWRRALFIALQECKKRAGAIRYALDDSSRFARHALVNANKAVKNCDRRLYRAVIDYLRRKAAEYEEAGASLVKASTGRRRALGADKLADAKKFRQQADELERRMAELFKNCPDDATRTATGTSPNGTPKASVTTGGARGECVVEGYGSVEELKPLETPGQTPVGEKLGTPTGQTAGPPTTPPPEDKKVPQTPSTPEKKETAGPPVTPPPSGEKKPPEKTAQTPTTPPGDTPVIYVKASIDVANQPANTPAQAVAGTTILLGNPNGPPPLPVQDDQPSQVAQNAGASGKPRRCTVDDKGECVISIDKVDTNPSVDPYDDLDPEGDYDPGNLEADLDRPLREKYNVGVNVKKSATAIIDPAGELSPTPPNKRGDSGLTRFAALTSSTPSASASDTPPMQLAQGNDKQPGKSSSALDIAIERINAELSKFSDFFRFSLSIVKIGDKEVIRVTGEGYDSKGLAELIRATWGYTVIIDPCRDPQPGPPVGMTAQKSCSAPAATASALPGTELTIPGIALPSATVRLAVRGTRP